MNSFLNIENQHDYQFSKGTIFSLCLSQAAVTVGVICFFQPVKIELYSIYPIIIIGTLDHHSPPKFRSTTLSLSTAVLASSLIAVVFSTTTAGLFEWGVLHQDNVYTQEILSDTGLWDLIFWLYCAIVHIIIFLVVMSPADTCAVALSSIQYSYFLTSLYQPRQNQLSMTQINITLLGLWVGLLTALHNLPDTHSGLIAAVLVMFILNYMLGIGHTWDSTPTMDVITNCRLFWVCSSSFCLAALYGAWHDHLLLEIH